MIYLAIPYSHPDPAVREERFQKANKIAGMLMAYGHMVFSPISHSHPIAVAHGLPTDFEWWRIFDSRFIEMCDDLYVVKLDGWKESRGIREEVRLARALGKSVCYFDEDQVL